MSRVFSAEEIALGRKVVIKVLPDELTGGVNVDRFKREIQFAARLQHPHIVQVLTAGEMDGVPFFTMPFVEGESVRGRLLRLGQLSITEVIGILRDVAKALAFAHEHGVVHRDIKPDNVLLSGGSAAVADFGIAKALSAARTDEGTGTLTQVGTSIGTPAYMAPEQAAADPATDHRSDLYSFGCLAYELLAGRPPFAAKTPQKLLAAHMGEAPKPVVQLRPDTPVALAEVIMRCLAKDADDRPQQAADIVRVLENVTSGTGHTAMPAILLDRKHNLRRAWVMYAVAAVCVPLVAKAAIIAIGLPDWVLPGAIIVILLGLPVILLTAYVQRTALRAATATPSLTPGGTPSFVQGTMATLAMKASPHVSWRRAALGGAASLGAFALLVGGFMTLRALGIGPAGSLLAAGVVSQNEKILVADFTSSRNDSTLGAVVTEAFRTSFGQSRTISVVQQGAIREALQLMQKPAGTRLDFAVAREIATREGIRAVVEGEVLGLGGRYVISARLLSPQTGEVLASFRQTADSDKEILSAIDNLAKDMRGKIGESLKSVRVTPSIERVTTPSLEALRKYVQAVRMFSTQDDWERAAGIMNEAIALDSGFAMAYRRLGMEYANQGNGPKADEFVQKAFEHRDRLSEVERYVVLGTYYAGGPHQDLVRAVAAYEQLLELQPDHTVALNNVGLQYNFQRRYPEAERSFKNAIAAGITSPVAYSNLIANLIEQRKFTDAKKYLADFRQRYPKNPRPLAAEIELQYATGTVDSAARIARNALGESGLSVRARANLLDYLSELAFTGGRFAEGEKLGAQVTALWREQGLHDAALRRSIFNARAAFWSRKKPALAMQLLDESLTKHPLSNISIGAQPLGELAEANALLGRLAPAKIYQAQWQERRRDIQRSTDEIITERIAGQIALAEGHYAEAVDKLRRGDTMGCSHCTLPYRSLAFESAGQPDSAVSLLQMYVVPGGAAKLTSDAIFLGPAYEKLGQLLEARGDRPGAAENYRKFALLWKNADADVQPRVSAARARAEVLSARH